MPSSPSVAPFCIPSGSTCCGDTFCNAGESCCGGGCCAAVSLFSRLPSLPPGFLLPCLVLKTPSLTHAEHYLQHQTHRLRLLSHRRPLLRSYQLLRPRLSKLLKPSRPSAAMLSSRHTLLPRLPPRGVGLLCFLHDRAPGFNKPTRYDRGGHFGSLCCFVSNACEHECDAYCDDFGRVEGRWGLFLGVSDTDCICWCGRGVDDLCP